VRGKLIYRTAMIAPFRLVLLGLVLFFYHDLYLGTFQIELFLKAGKLSWWDVIQFHLKYPTEFFLLSGLVIPPVVYYGLIRGVRFYEKGYLFNRGLPFLNSWFNYEQASHYKLLAPKSIIAIFSNSGEIHLVADGNIERVIATLDQHGVKGDLAQEAQIRLIQNVKKFLYVVLFFTMVIYTALKIGLFRFVPTL
jgi:hypothetical protein